LDQFESDYLGKLRFNSRLLNELCNRMKRISVTHWLLGCDRGNRI